ncbi:hypothetical protein WOLCODRAFT_165690 [Wolfiporia cocos MD-104 SS10]|uniref:Uncharacterized protein n=1 Tax=Wolfiporia cocos (strain MD-104) TaxID=742152 RepID=A0A2H3JF34_WOLCO|nr:hypothetical protein WOLCODRAFT_165690 [Wolfiporia cocos MD-104 SS10]
MTKRQPRQNVDARASALRELLGMGVEYPASARPTRLPEQCAPPVSKFACLVESDDRRRARLPPSPHSPGYPAGAFAAGDVAGHCALVVERAVDDGGRFAKCPACRSPWAAPQPESSEPSDGTASARSAPRVDVQPRATPHPRGPDIHLAPWALLGLAVSCTLISNPNDSWRMSRETTLEISRMSVGRPQASDGRKNLAAPVERWTVDQLGPRRLANNVGRSSER